MRSSSVRPASSCWRTIFSEIFDMKERLETGRKFSYYLGQDKVFLTTGFTTDDLKVDGKSTRQQLEIDDVRKSWEEAIDKFKK